MIFWILYKQTNKKDIFFKQLYFGFLQIFGDLMKWIKSLKSNETPSNVIENTLENNWIYQECNRR